MIWILNIFSGKDETPFMNILYGGILEDQYFNELLLKRPRDQFHVWKATTGSEIPSLSFSLLS